MTHTKQLLLVTFCDTTAGIGSSFGHMQGQRTDGRTDWRGSSNSYLDFDCFSNEIVQECFISPSIFQLRKTFDWLWTIMNWLGFCHRLANFLSLFYLFSLFMSDSTRSLRFFNGRFFNLATTSKGKVPHIGLDKKVCSKTDSEFLRS